MPLEILLSGLVAAPAVSVRLSGVSTCFAFVMFVARIEAFALWLSATISLLREPLGQLGNQVLAARRSPPHWPTFPHHCGKSCAK